MLLFIVFEQIWTILDTVIYTGRILDFLLKLSLDSFAFLLSRSLKHAIMHGSTSAVDANFTSFLNKFGQVLVKTRKLHWTKMAMFFLKVSLDSLAFLLPRSLKRVIRHGSTSEVNANLRFNVEIAISP